MVIVVYKLNSMKKIALVLLVLVSATTFAQRSERGDQKDKMSAEQIATLQTKKMTLALDLNEAQQSQMMALNLENAKMRMKNKEARNSPEERKKRTADERYEMANQRLDAQIAQKEKIKQILTDEQFAKWEKMKKHRGKKARGMRKAHGKEKMKKEN